MIFFRTSSKNHRRCKITSAMLVFLLLFAAGTLSGCEKETASVSKTGFFLDTVVSITLYDTENTSPLEECFSRLASYEETGLPHAGGRRRVGELITVNGNPVEELHGNSRSVVKKALSYCRLSDGAFDIIDRPLCSAAVGTLTRRDRQNRNSAG